MIARIINRLRCNRRGTTTLEFAVIVPTLMVVIMGLLDFTYRLYATSIVQGAVQKAARDSTLEMNATQVSQDAIDTKVRDAVKDINGVITDSSFTISRVNFANFSDAGKMEASTGPGGLCAPGYVYIDKNNNSVWDNGGNAGQGGADDVTLYDVQVQYKALFPINALFGASNMQTIRAKTLLRNQPYNTQAVRASGTTRPCP
jgi:Flp pilus assembly protein TadG